jgi:putative tryptophan/tyrosine transport system substrate-binding protein
MSAFDQKRQTALHAYWLSGKISKIKRAWLEEWVRRRDFIKTLAGLASLWPLVARAQRSTTPVIGFLDATSFDKYAPFVEAFRKGLREVGFVDGHNVTIEFRWAEGQYSRLPRMAAELVQNKVAVIVATGITAARAAKGATTTTPIIFQTGGDPIKFGLVNSFSRPGQNVTGVASMNKILVAKQLEIIHEIIPRADTIAFLVNPNNAASWSSTRAMRRRPLPHWERS